MGRPVFLGLLTVVLAAGLSAAVAAEPDVRLISQGRPVELEQHLVPGKLVVFDFYADWCAPCRVVTPELERLAATHPDRLALRKIDVVNWESPVTRQHRIGSLPHLVLFGPDGARLAEGDAQRVLGALGARLGADVGGRSAPSRTAVPPAVWIGLLAALVVAAAVFRRRSLARRPPGPTPSPDDAPRVWLVMTPRGLEGPFSVRELAERSRAAGIGNDARVRRQGDTTWRRLGDVTGSA